MITSNEFETTHNLYSDIQGGCATCFALRPTLTERSRFHINLRCLELVKLYASICCRINCEISSWSPYPRPWGRSYIQVDALHATWF